MRRLSPKAHEGTSFFDLPREIRDEIYGYYLIDIPPPKLMIHTITSHNGTTVLHGPVNSLSEACRQTHDELKPLLFRAINVQWHKDCRAHSAAAFQQSLNALPMDVRPDIRTLTFIFYQIHDGSWESTNFEGPCYLISPSCWSQISKHLPSLRSMVLRPIFTTASLRSRVLHCMQLLEGSSHHRQVSLRERTNDLLTVSLAQDAAGACGIVPDWVKLEVVFDRDHRRGAESYPKLKEMVNEVWKQYQDPASIGKEMPHP